MQVNDVTNQSPKRGPMSLGRRSGDFALSLVARTGCLCCATRREKYYMIKLLEGAARSLTVSLSCNPPTLPVCLVVMYWQEVNQRLLPTYLFTAVVLVILRRHASLSPLVDGNFPSNR